MELVRHTRQLTAGREIDDRLGMLTGEGSGMRISRIEPERGSTPVDVWSRDPSEQGTVRDYYRIPLLKEPVWIWSVPLYFYVGGVAGGGAVLAAAVHGGPGMGRLAARCRLLAFIGTTLGPALLTWDLGRMTRFVYMLRVFRPTSPMSIGSWSLAATGLIASLSLLVKQDTLLGRVLSLKLAAGGLMLSGYTGVLLANSANPLWKTTRLVLPPLFTASSMASTAALLELLPLSRREERVLDRFGIMGKGAEAVAMLAMELQASRNPEAAGSLREGISGLLWRGSSFLLAAGMLLALIPTHTPARRRTGAALTTAGALCLRFALLEAGKSSAREPRAAWR